MGTGTLDDIFSARLANQLLTGPGAQDAPGVARRLLAVQHQEWVGGMMSFAQRCGASAARVQEELDAGALIRTHVLRPTWHTVAAEDLRWLIDLTGPRVRQTNGSMLRREGIDDDMLARGERAIEAALSDDEPLTRNELAAHLDAAGLAAKGFALTYQAMHAELIGLICSGPRRGKQHTYRLVDRAVPAALPLDRDDALARLAIRYFAGHGPATLKDLSWWSSLTLADLRRGVDLAGDALERREVDGVSFYAAPGAWDTSGGGPRRSDAAASSGRLWFLQQFDEIGVGYRESRGLLDRAGRVESAGSSAGGMALPAPGDQPYYNPVVLDGQLVGWWRVDYGTRSARLAWRLYPGIDPDLRDVADLTDWLQAFYGIEDVEIDMPTPV